MAETITLADDSATNSIFEDTNSNRKNEMLFRDQASTLTEPDIFRVAHSSLNDGTDRHLVQRTRTTNDAELVPRNDQVHVVIWKDRLGADIAVLKKDWEQLKNYVDANFESIAGGFTPTD